MRKYLLPAIALFILTTALPVIADDKEDPVVSIAKSAGVKGGEVAAKLLAGLLYDTSCVNRNNDQFTGYVCTVLGSASGRTEDKWKADVTKQLGEINAKVDALTVGQRDIQKSLKQMNESLENQFNTVAQNVVAYQHLVKIQALWEKYREQFDKVDKDVERDAMLAFAHEIIAEKPHTMLAELNAVLTEPIPATGGQPLLRYPFAEWRIAHSSGMGYEPNAMEAYEYGEARFVDFRMREEQAYVMYLWAATVLETQCTLHPGACQKPPRSTAEVKADWNRFTRQQAAAFNASVDWLLLSYSGYRTTKNGSFLTPRRALDIFQRANYVTSTILGDGEGMWGRVISAGKAWDGALQVTCGGAAQTLKPVLEYTVPVAGSGENAITKSSGPVDWWVSTSGNAVYDEVHFASDWRNYIYSIPAAKPGPCSVSTNLPKGGLLPWVESNLQVSQVPDEKKPFPFGSFVAIQRAGGHYALVSGDWSGSSSPSFDKQGAGELVTQADEWYVEPNHSGGPQLGLYRKGRAEYSVRLDRLSSRVHLVHRLAVSNRKEIRFPEDSRVKVSYFPGGCEREFCGGLGGNSILAYDVENNDTEAKKGTLEAKASVLFVDTSNAGSKSGLSVDGSYGKTGDHKTLNVSGSQTATATVDPRKRYHLTYAIDFDLWTEGRGTNASDFWYRALLAPATVYVTRSN